MELLLQRRAHKPTYTIGTLYVDGVWFKDQYVGGVRFSDTLEDVVRDLKADGSGKLKDITAIPAGRYQVVLAMSPSKKRILPVILNVPFFKGILIHRGNTADHSSGCILVGENTSVGRVNNSTPYEDKLVALLTEAEARNEKSYITIKNNPNYELI